MKLILTADVPNLGGPGDIVEVKDGYGRNLLLPRKLAIPATRGAEKQVEAIKRAQRARQIRDLSHAKEVAGQLEALDLTVKAKAAGDSGRLFGSVTSQQIAVELRKQGFEIDRKDVELDEDIRVTGVYSATVRVFKGVDARVTIEVISEGAADS